MFYSIADEERVRRRSRSRSREHRRHSDHHRDHHKEYRESRNSGDHSRRSSHVLDHKGHDDHPRRDRALDGDDDDYDSRRRVSAPSYHLLYLYIFLIVLYVYLQPQDAAYRRSSEHRNNRHRSRSLTPPFERRHDINDAKSHNVRRRPSFYHFHPLTLSGARTPRRIMNPPVKPQGNESGNAAQARFAHRSLPLRISLILTTK